MKVASYLFRSHLDPGEEILAVCHRHPFVILSQVLGIIFYGFLLPAVLWYLFPEISLLCMLFIFIHMIRLVYAFSNWYHDALLITNVSLLRVGWFGFFDKTSSRLEYQMIEGISYTVKGVIRTIFNYGEVVVARSGGNSMAFHLPDAMNPPKVERLIMKYQEQFVSHQNLKDADTLKNLLTAMLRHHAKSEGIPSNEE